MSELSKISDTTKIGKLSTLIRTKLGDETMVGYFSKWLIQIWKKFLI